jgi:hypothetical protein
VFVWVWLQCILLYVWGSCVCRFRMGCGYGIFALGTSSMGMAQ